MLVSLLILQLKLLEELDNSSRVVRLQFQLYEVLYSIFGPKFSVLWQIRTICILRQKMTSVKGAQGWSCLLFSKCQFCKVHLCPTSFGGGGGGEDLRIKGKIMTLQNTGISARLWNPCAKGSEQPFRQGAICQQDQRTSDTRSQMRLRKCAGHLKRRKTCSPPVTARHST